MNIDIDSYDLVICVALVGGFATGNWLPFIVFGIILLISELPDKRDKDV